MDANNGTLTINSFLCIINWCVSKFLTCLCFVIYNNYTVSGETVCFRYFHKVDHLNLMFQQMVNDESGHQTTPQSF